jgi:subtilisin family serine protease
MSRVSAIEPAEQELLLSDLERMFFYVHGTHVAGVAVEGNPFVRVLSIADSSMGAGFVDLSDPVAYGRKWADFCARNIAYLKRANVRVVNMSWGNSPRDCRSLLEAWNIGASPEERRRLGREMYLAMREGLEAAIRSAPEMLFITVAGNNNEDVDFVELIPAGLRIPNLVTLGAVDSADRLTSFTNTGESVELFANGDLVESFLPGGARVKWSGTSLSGPQLANLAAKMLALRPELKPTEIMDLVRANADPLPEDPGRSIINPKRTIEALRRGAFVRSFACVGSIALRLSSGTSPRWRTP